LSSRPFSLVSRSLLSSLTEVSSRPSRVRSDKTKLVLPLLFSFVFLVMRFSLVSSNCFEKFLLTSSFRPYLFHHFVFPRFSRKFVFDCPSLAARCGSGRPVYPSPSYFFSFKGFLPLLILDDASPIPPARSLPFLRHLPRPPLSVRGKAIRCRGGRLLPSTRDFESCCFRRGFRFFGGILFSFFPVLSSLFSLLSFFSHSGRPILCSGLFLFFFFFFVSFFHSAICRSPLRELTTFLSSPTFLPSFPLLAFLPSGLRAAGFCSS